MGIPSLGRACQRIVPRATTANGNREAVSFMMIRVAVFVGSKRFDENVVL
jgi:hypothetical protein